MRLQRSVLAAVILATATLSSLGLGCSSAEERTEEPEQDEEALRMVDAFTDAVSDFGAKVTKSPCAWLERLGQKDRLFHLGFVYGYQADASVDVIAEANVDYVWDLYDQEMIVSRHRGRGFLPKNTSNVGVHAGVIYGFDQSVLEFQGRLVNANVEFGVPLANDLIGASVTGFATGTAASADGQIGLKDIDADGLVGFVASLSGGFDTAKSERSSAGKLTVGLAEDVYEVAPEGVRAIYDELKKADVDVSLVTKDDAACPSAQGVGCALAFGRKHSSHFLRARAFADGLRKHAGKAESMVSAIASTALAVGAVRDLASGGRSLSAATGRLCPQNRPATPAK